MPLLLLEMRLNLTNSQALMTETKAVPLMISRRCLIEGSMKLTDDFGYKLVEITTSMRQTLGK